MTRNKIPFQLPCGIGCTKARECIQERKCVIKDGKKEVGEEASKKSEGSEGVLQQRVDTSETVVVHSELTETNVDEVGPDTNTEDQESTPEPEQQ